MVYLSIRCALATDLCSQRILSDILLADRNVLKNSILFKIEIRSRQSITPWSIQSCRGQNCGKHKPVPPKNNLRMIRQNKQCQHWVRILWFQLEPQPCFLCFLHHYYYKVNKLENSNVYILYVLIKLFQPNKYNIYTLYLFLSSILCWTLLLHFPQTNIALFWCSFRLFVRLNIFPFTTDDAR